MLSDGTWGLCRDAAVALWLLPGRTLHGLRPCRRRPSSLTQAVTVVDTSMLPAQLAAVGFVGASRRRSSGYRGPGKLPVDPSTFPARFAHALEPVLEHGVVAKGHQGTRRLLGEG